MASYNSTSFLLFKTASPFRASCPKNRIAVPCFTGGQIRPSKWATSDYQSGPVCSIEVGQFRALPRFWCNRELQNNSIVKCFKLLGDGTSPEPYAIPSPQRRDSDPRPHRA